MHARTARASRFLCLGDAEIAGQAGRGQVAGGGQGAPRITSKKRPSFSLWGSSLLPGLPHFPISSQAGGV